VRQTKPPFSRTIQCGADPSFAHGKLNLAFGFEFNLGVREKNVSSTSDQLFEGADEHGTKGALVHVFFQLTLCCLVHDEGRSASVRSAAPERRNSCSKNKKCR
jgi:hypothetical protein